MRWVAKVIFAAVAAAAGPAPLLDQNPEVPRTESGQHASQQQGAPASEAPIVVEEIHRQKAKDGITNEDTHERNKAESDEQMVRLTADLARYTELLFFATAALVCGTFGLVFFGFRQARDMQESVSATKKSVEIAERALVDLERPHLFLEFTSHDLSISAGGQFLFGSPVEFQFANLGRTPANITEILEVWDAAEDDSLPAPIDPFITGGKRLPVGSISSPDRPYKLSTEIC